MTRLEKLQAKMREENAIAAQPKPVKSSKVKPVAQKPRAAKPAPQPEPEVRFVVPPMSLASTSYWQRHCHS